MGELGADPAGEVLASRLAAHILPQGASVTYDLVQYGGQLFSSCPLMTSPDEELVSARAFTMRGPRPNDNKNCAAVWDEATMTTCECDARLPGRQRHDGPAHTRDVGRAAAVLRVLGRQGVERGAGPGRPVRARARVSGGLTEVFY